MCRLASPAFGEKRRGFRRLRVALLFGYFLLGKQEKVTRRRAASGIKAVKASPEAIPITPWIPAFAGMTEGMHRRRRFTLIAAIRPLLHKSTLSLPLSLKGKGDR